MFFFTLLWYVVVTESYAQTYSYFETNTNDYLIKNDPLESERLFPKKTPTQSENNNDSGRKDTDRKKSEEEPSIQDSEDIEDPQIDPVQTMEYLNQLNEGVGLYQSGKRADAMQRFLSLSMLPEVPNDIRQESIVYIAEILYIQGDKESAKRFFEQLLMDDPNYQIDRFRHPPDVCGYFDFVKSYTKQLAPKKKSEEVQSFPVVGYFPIGTYFWLEKDSRLGKRFLHTGLQGGFLLTSSILYASLLVNHEYLESDNKTKEILERRLAWQRVTTVAFYALWGINIIDAQRSWQITQQEQLLNKSQSLEEK